MTDISGQARKRALDAVKAEAAHWGLDNNEQYTHHAISALARYIQEVSDVAKDVMPEFPAWEHLRELRQRLQSLILPDEPDVLEQALRDIDGSDEWGDSYAKNAELVRAELDKRGYRIVPKGDEQP